MISGCGRILNAIKQVLDMPGCHGTLSLVSPTRKTQTLITFGICTLFKCKAANQESSWECWPTNLGKIRHAFFIFFLWLHSERKQFNKGLKAWLIIICLHFPEKYGHRFIKYKMTEDLMAWARYRTQHCFPNRLYIGYMHAPTNRNGSFFPGFSQI